MPRPETTARDARRPLFVGVDVGGTNIKFGLVDDAGATLAYTSIPTEDEKGCDDAISRMRSTIAQLLEEHGLAWDEVAAVGLATPGTMDIPGGMILAPVNLPGWRYYPLREKLSEATGKPVTFANDANAAAFGEFWVGSGSEYPSLTMLTLGTGVGGGIIIGDLSVDGEHSHGSELGHTIIDYHENARLCSCGQRGHLEAYASATAVVARTQQALDEGRHSSLEGRMKQGDKLTSLVVYQEATAGDELAREIVMDTARFVGIGAVTLLHTIDPAALVLGGAMDFGGPGDPLGDEFLTRVRQEIDQRAFPVVAENVVVNFASLGGDAGYLGAAGLARAEYRRKS